MPLAEQSLSSVGSQHYDNPKPLNRCLAVNPDELAAYRDILIVGPTTLQKGADVRERTRLNVQLSLRVTTRPFQLYDIVPAVTQPRAHMNGPAERCQSHADS